MIKRQGLNEANETCFYDVLNLCWQVKQEMEYEMSETTTVEPSLIDLTADLL